MKEFVSWDLIDECVTEIAVHLKDTSKDFKGVYGIPRGGALLGVMLSHKLNLPYMKDIVNYSDWEFVIIDDIADTGNTLLDYLNMPECKNAYYVTIHEHEQCIVKPDFSVVDKGDKWIVYPWETTDSKEIQDYLK